MSIKLDEACINRLSVNKTETPNTDYDFYVNGTAAISNNLSVLGTINSGTWNGSTIAVAYGGTGATTAKNARANLGTWSLINDTYNTLMPADGTTNDWIKIGTANFDYGLLPSRPGNAGSGHNYLGSSRWYWSAAYIDTVYGNLDGNAATSTKANALANLYDSYSRPTDANIAHVRNGGVTHFKATSAMTSNSPGEGNILHFHWDTSDAWDSQLFVPDVTGSYMRYRSHSSASTWYDWRTLLDSTNYSSYALPLTGGTLTGTLKIAPTGTSNTTTIGSQNNNFCHIYNSANIPFIFNNSVYTITGNLGSASYPWNNLYIGSSNNCSIYYVGSKNTYQMIQFIDNTSDTYGNGIAIGGGGQTIIGGGESTNILVGQTSTNGSEIMWIGNDGDIELFPGQQNGFNSAYKTTINSSGIHIGIEGNTTKESSLKVSSGAGSIGLYSSASTAGNRALWAPPHGTDTSGKNIITLDTNNNIHYNTGTAGYLYMTSGSGVVHISGAPMLCFLRGNDQTVPNRMGAIFCNYGTTNSITRCDRIYLRHYSYNSSTGATINDCDQYCLPAVTPDLTTSHTYNILTTKDMSFSITGNAATATLATKAIGDSDGNTINTTYAKLSGAAFTGNITITKAGDTYVYSKNSSTGNTIYLDSGAGTYHGIWSDGYYNGSSYISSGDWLIYRNGAGNVIVNGDCTGNAAAASKLTDITASDASSSTDTWRRMWFSYNDNVTGRPSYSDNFAYQSSTGTIKVGRISCWPSSGSNNFNEGIRIHQASNGWGSITFCGNDNTGDTGTSANSWGVYNNQGNFYISRNGSNNASTSLKCVSNVWEWSGTANGSISGNAATATLAAKATGDSDGNTINTTYAKLSGGLFTENTSVKKASGYAYFESQRTDTGLRLTLEVDDSMHGIWSNGYVNNGTFTSSSRWLIYRNNEGTVIVNGNCTGNAAAATKDGAGNVISSTYLKLSGGAMSGHIYLSGANPSSSTANTTQIVFGTSSNQHLAITSNTKALVLNPTTSSTTNQIVFYLEQASIIPKGITVKNSNGTSITINGGYGTLAGATRSYVNINNWLNASGITGAVWNDYAEFRKTNKEAKAGQVVVDNDDGSLSITNKRLMPGAQIVSDTFGFSIGETEEAKTPLAVSGRVLVYTYRPREEYHAGMAVCSAPNGTIDIMTRKEIQQYPDAIIGIVSEIPEYEEWGTGKVKVNGRIWIKIK